MNDDRNETPSTASAVQTPESRSDREHEASTRIKKTRRMRRPGPVPAMSPSVIEVQLEQGREWVFASWRDPGGASRLRTELASLMEAALLLAMSQPPSSQRLERYYSGLQVVVFDEVAGDLDSELGKLGFERDVYDADGYAERMEVLRSHAASFGHELPDHPLAVYRTPIVRPRRELDDVVERIHDDMIERLAEETWGDKPGKFSRVLAEYLRQHFGVTIEPGYPGLETMDVLLVDHDPGQVRWIPPLIFQALCDFVAIVLQAEHDLRVQWAVSEVGDDGFPDPPFMRIKHDDDDIKAIPIGLRMLQWCVMPNVSGMSTLLTDKVKHLDIGS